MKFLIYVFFIPTLLAGQIISSFPHTEDFQSGAGGWTTGGTTNWVRGLVNKPTIQSAVGGSIAWTNNGLATPYPSSEQSWVQSPRYDFTSLQFPHISFTAWWETEYQYDGVVLAYSTDGGTTWTQTGNDTDPVNCLNANWYNRNSTTYVDWPAANRDSWSGNSSNIVGGGCVNGNGSGGWVPVQHCLPASLGGQTDVRFRFHLGAGTTCHDDGFAFDNFTIQESPIAANFGIVSCVGNTVTFSDLSTHCATAWSWNFGDAGTSSLQNPSHSYATAGTYTVTLTVTNPCGKTNSISQVVNVGSCVLPQTLTAFSVERWGSFARLEWKTGEPVPGTIFTIYAGASSADMNATSEFRVLPGDSRTVFMADEEIPSGTPFRYYQIRMTDDGGNVHFSPIRQLSTGTGTTWTIFPNPVVSGSTLTLVTGDPEILGNIEWIHADGRVFSPPMVTGEGTVVFSTQGMPLGMYLVKARTSIGTTCSRIIISE